MIRYRKDKVKEKKFNKKESATSPNITRMNLLIFTLKLFLETSYVFLCFFQLLSQFPTRRKKYTNLNKIDDVINDTMENKIESQEHLNIFLQAEEKCLLTSYILSYLFSWICMNLKQNPCLAFAGLYLNKVYALWNISLSGQYFHANGFPRLWHNKRDSSACDLINQSDSIWGSVILSGSDQRERIYNNGNNFR